MSLEYTDQSEAIRQMGRDDRRKGIPCEAGERFWWPKSLALKHWLEGWDSASRQFVQQAFDFMAR